MSLYRRPIRIVAFASAVVLGVMLASKDRNFPIGDPSARNIADGIVSNQSASTDYTHTAKPVSPVGEFDEALRFSTGSGASLRSAKRGARFVGFEVIEAGSDSRLKTGHVIISVNGVPVEDSAAGSELLLAALEDDEAIVQLRPIDR